MKISKKPLTTSTKIKYLLVATGLILVAGGLYWYFYTQTSDGPTDNPEDQSVVEEPEPAPATLDDEDARAKKEYVERIAEDEKKPDQDRDSVSATAEFTPSQEGDLVVLRTRLTSIGDGSCTINISNGQRTYTETVDVLYQPIHSTCAGFSVPRSELGAGDWSITLKATSLENHSASITKTLKVT